MMLHTYIPNQCPYQVSTSYTFWFLRYSPGQEFSHGLNAHPHAMGENNARTAFKGCGIKMAKKAAGIFYYGKVT